jgi:hypothetical protein
MSTSRIRPTSASIMVRLRQTRPVPDSFGLWRHDELSRRQVEVVSTLPFLETRVNLSRGGFASDKERLTCPPATPDRALSTCYDFPLRRPYAGSASTTLPLLRCSSAAYQRPTRLIPIITAEDLTRPAADRQRCGLIQRVGVLGRK